MHISDAFHDFFLYLKLLIIEKSTPKIFIVFVVKSMQLISQTAILTPSRELCLNTIFKQLQLILTQLIVMHATPNNSIIGFPKVSQHILNVIYVMKLSESKF